MKKIMLGLLMGLFIVLLGCAPFKSQQSDGLTTKQAELGSRLYLDGEINQQEYLSLLAAQPVTDPFAANSNSSFFEMKKTLGISYKHISNLIITALQAFELAQDYPNDCDPSAFTPYEIGRVNGLNCGEIPFGDIVDRNHRKIIDIDIPGQVGEENDVSYNINGFRLSFFATRQQKKSVSNISDLSFQENVDIRVSGALFKSTYIKLSPLENKLVTTLCTFVPGFDIDSYDFSTHGSFKKKLWGFIPLKANATIRIAPGRISFDHAKICGAFKTQVGAERESLDVGLVGFEAPEFKNMIFSGIKSHVDVDLKGILKFINFFTRIFGYNIEKEVAKKANQAIEEQAQATFVKITEEQVQSGEWLKRIFEEEFLDQMLVDNINRRVRKVLKEEGPGDSLLLSQRLEAACIIAAEKVPSELHEDFLTLCRNSFNITADVFVQDQESELVGCYQHYFNPFETRGVDSGYAWWANRCEIQNRISIIIPKPLIPLYDCMAELGGNGRILDLAIICKPEIEHTLEEIKNNPEITALIIRAETIRDTRSQEYLDGVIELLNEYGYNTTGL